MKLRTIGSILLSAALLLSFVGNANGSIFHKEQNHSYEIQKFSSSDDTYADSQWYINNPGFYTNYSFKTSHKINSDEGIDTNVGKAWDYIKQKENEKHEVVVAVIDTGVDYNHPDLAKNMWINKGEIPGDNIDNDHNGYVDDIYGWDFYNQDASVYAYEEEDGQQRASYEDNDNHGTHVAGIIAAVANNNQGIAGIASNVNIKIMSLKVNGGTNGSGNMDNAVQAINYAEKMGADICNISWGALGYTQQLRDTIKNSKMLFVAAAGNFTADNDLQPVYPASFHFNNMISVTAIDALGQLGEKADFGLKSVDVAAPGIDIYSTVVGGYDYMSGTSMAAPQVSAIAALVYAAGNKPDAAQVKSIILNNVKELSQLKGVIKYNGIPDAYQIVKAVNEVNKKSEEKSNAFVLDQNSKPVNEQEMKEIKLPKHGAIHEDVNSVEDILPKENAMVTITLFGQINSFSTDIIKLNKTIHSDWKRRSLYRRI